MRHKQHQYFLCIKTAIPPQTQKQSYYIPEYYTLCFTPFLYPDLYKLFPCAYLLVRTSTPPHVFVLLQTFFLLHPYHISKPWQKGIGSLYWIFRSLWINEMESKIPKFTQSCNLSVTYDTVMYAYNNILGYDIEGNRWTFVRMKTKCTVKYYQYYSPLTSCSNNIVNKKRWNYSPLISLIMAFSPLHLLRHHSTGVVWRGLAWLIVACSCTAWGS